MNKSVMKTTCAVFLSAAVLAGCVSAVDEMSSAKEPCGRTAWKMKVGERLLKNPAFAYVEDDPELPRVLIIGDSISIGYTATVREELSGKANVHRIPENGGHTAKGLENFDKWTGKKKWDVIHFNWGLHDLKYMKDGKLDPATGTQLAPAEVYGKNLEMLVRRLKNTGAHLIWAATTPVPEGSKGRVPGDAKKYNGVAARIMDEHGVPINDLFGHIIDKLDTYQRPANVHFIEEGSSYLGKKVAKEVLNQLKPGRDNKK